MEPLQPSWRKPFGVIALLVYIALYAGAVLWLAPTIDGWPTAFKVIAYLVLGLAWLPPVKPLLRWMAR